MLRVTYTGGDAPQHFLFDPDAVDVEEAERIEGALKAGWDTLIMSLLSPSARLRRVLLWHLLRQANPGYDLRFEDTPNFKMGQLVIELGTREIDVMIGNIAAEERWTEERKSAAIEALTKERVNAVMAEDALEGDEVTADPKEPEPVAVVYGSPVTEGAPDRPFPSVLPAMPFLPSSPTT